MTLRVLHLTTVASPVAGAELTSLLLARELPSHGIDLEVCTLSPAGILNERLEALGRGTHSLGARGSVTGLPAYVRLQRAIRRHRPHIIHGQLFHASIVAAWVAKVARLPFVLTRQYVWSVEWYRGRMAQRLDAWAARQAQQVVAISSETKMFLEHHFALPPERIQIVHNAADVDCFTNQPRRSGREIRLAYVASLHPRKGHRHLLEAIRMLKEHGKLVHLDLVGDGEERSALEQMARSLGIDDRVSFLGWQQDVAARLNAVDLHVHPAIEEAFGIAIVEAMATGLPVVASRTGGIPDVVVDGETGFLVPPANAEAFANSMVRLIDDPGRRVAFGAAGRARALSVFSPQKMAESYAEIFRTTLDRRR